MSDCLVLNQNFVGVETIPWEDAIFKLLLGKVEVVTPHKEKKIRTVTMEFSQPLVVRLIRGGNTKGKAAKFSRYNIYDRDQGRCQYCGHVVTRKEATNDHVIPRSQGGKTNWTNIVTACLPCNQRKGCRTPEQAGMKLRSVPRKPDKLPNSIQVMMAWRPGMPEEWIPWMRDAKRDITYWHGKLEES